LARAWREPQASALDESAFIDPAFEGKADLCSAGTS